MVDFSTEQLKKDQLVAEQFGKAINILKADMRDLGALKTASFDVIYPSFVFSIGAKSVST